MNHGKNKENAKEKSNRNVKKNNLVIAQTVAILLGGIVLPCPPEREYGYCNCFPCTFPNGDKILLSFDRYNNTDKIMVIGDYATRIRNPASSVGISVRKTPEHIARDIARRFMPEYMQKAQEAREQKKQEDEYANTQERLKTELCNIPGVTKHCHGDGMSISAPNGVSGTIRYVSNTRTVSIDHLSCSIDQLRRLLNDKEV